MLEPRMILSRLSSDLYVDLKSRDVCSNGLFLWLKVYINILFLLLRFVGKEQPEMEVDYPPEGISCLYFSGNESAVKGELEFDSCRTTTTRKRGIKGAKHHAKQLETDSHASQPVTSLTKYSVHLLSWEVHSRFLFPTSKGCLQELQLLNR